MAQSGDPTRGGKQKAKLEQTSSASSNKGNQAAPDGHVGQRDNGRSPDELKDHGSSSDGTSATNMEMDNMNFDIKIKTASVCQNHSIPCEEETWYIWTYIFRSQSHFDSLKERFKKLGISITFEGEEVCIQCNEHEDIDRIRNFTEQILKAYRNENKIEAISAHLTQKKDKIGICKDYQQFYEKAMFFPGNPNDPFIWVVAKETVAKKICQTIESEINKTFAHTRTQRKLPNYEKDFVEVRRTLSKQRTFAQVFVKWPYFKEKLSELNFTFQDDTLIVKTHEREQAEKLLDNFLSELDRIYINCYDDFSTSPEMTDMLKVDSVKDYVGLALQESHFDNCLMILEETPEGRTYPRIFHLSQYDPRQIIEIIKNCFFEFPEDHFMCRFISASKALQNYGAELVKKYKGKMRILRLEDDSYSIMGACDVRDDIHLALSEKIKDLKCVKAVALRNEIVQFVKRFKSNEILDLEKKYKVKIELKRVDRTYELLIDGPQGYVDNCHRVLSSIVQKVIHKQFHVTEPYYQLPEASKCEAGDKYKCFIRDIGLKPLPNDVTQQWSLQDGALSVSVSMDRDDEHRKGIVITLVPEQQEETTKILDEASSLFEKQIYMPSMEVGEDEVESRIKKQVDTIFQNLPQHTAHSVSFLLSSVLYSGKTALTVFKRGLHNFCRQEIINVTACHFYHNDRKMMEELVKVADKYLERNFGDKSTHDKSRQGGQMNSVTKQSADQRKRQNAENVDHRGAVVLITSDTDEQCDKAWQGLQSIFRRVKANPVTVPSEQNIDERARLGEVQEERAGLGQEREENGSTCSKNVMTSIQQSRLVRTKGEECCCMVYITENLLKKPEEIKSCIRKDIASYVEIKVFVYPFLHKNQGLMKFATPEDCTCFLQRKFPSFQTQPFPPQAVNNVKATLSDVAREKLKALHFNEKSIFENSGAVLCKETDWILLGNLLEIKAAHIYLDEVLKNGNMSVPKLQNSYANALQKSGVRQPFENTARKEFQMTNQSKERRHCSELEHDLMLHFVKDFKENLLRLIVSKPENGGIMYMGNNSTIKIIDDAKIEIGNIKHEQIDLTDQELQKWETCRKDFQKSTDVLLLNSKKGLDIYGMEENVRQAKIYIEKAVCTAESSIKRTMKMIAQDIPSQYFKYLEDYYPKIVHFCTVLRFNDEMTRVEFPESRETEFITAVETVSSFRCEETVYMQGDEEVQKICEAIEVIGKNKDVVIHLDIEQNRVVIKGTQEHSVRSVKRKLVEAKSKAFHSRQEKQQKFHDPLSRQSSLQSPSPHDYVLSSHLIKTYVYHADILKLNVDCIVNPTGKSLSTKQGLAGIILNAAGKQVEIECGEQGKMSAGDIFPTVGGKLHYSNIIHTVVPVWKDLEQYGGEDIVEYCSNLLSKCILECLKYSSSKHTSIALPVIGAGKRGGIPKILCASAYARTVKKFCSEKSKSLSSIHIVDTLSENIQVVREAFLKPWLLWSYTFPDGKIKCMFPRNLTVNIFKGEFWKTTAKAIAVSADAQFKNETWSSKKISEIAGEEYKKERKLLECKTKWYEAGKVKFCRKINENLPVKYVAHVVMNTSDYLKCITSLLKEVNAVECESLAFPFFGAGSGDHTNWYRFAQIMFTAIKDFADGSKKELKLRDIYIVNKNDQITSVLRDTFSECICNTYDKDCLKKYCNCPIIDRSVKFTGEDIQVKVKNK